jgi:hypothetical protein
MSRLLDSHGNVLSQHLIHWLPRMEPIVVVNRTLDGQYHRQTIGSAVRLFDLELIANDLERSAIQQAWATGALLRAEVEGWYRSGPLDAAPDPQLIRRGPMATREYLVKLTIAVNAEGAI